MMQGCYVISVAFIVLSQNAFGFAAETAESPSSQSADQHLENQDATLSRNKRGSYYIPRIARGLHMLRLGKRGDPSSPPHPWYTYNPSELENLADFLSLQQTYESDGFPYSSSSPYEQDDGYLDGDEDEEFTAPSMPKYRYRRSADIDEKEEEQLSSGMEPEQPPELDDDIAEFYPSYPLTEEELDELFRDEEIGKDDVDKRGLNNMLRLGKRQIPMLRLGKRQIPMLRLGKRGGLSMLRLGKKDTDWSSEDSVGDSMEEKRGGLSMLRLGKKDMDWEPEDESQLEQDNEKRGLSMLRLGKKDALDDEVSDDEEKRAMAMLRLGKRPMSMLRLGKRPMSMLRLGKRPMSMLRLGKRPMSMLRLGKRPMSMLRLGRAHPMSFLRLAGKRSMNMLRLGKRPMSMLRLGKRPMSMLRLGKRPMSMLRLGKRPMSMLRLGKRPMSMLRLGKRPMSMLRLGKRPMSMLRLGKRPMSMLRLGKRQDEEVNAPALGEDSIDLSDDDKDKRLNMLRLGKRSAQ